ncbi:hypothetical protein ALC53_03159, partial [Atta colombica]
IFKGGTLGAELESKHFNRSSSSSDSGGAGVPFFALVELEVFEGFGLVAIEEALGLFLCRQVTSGRCVISTSLTTLFQLTFTPEDVIVPDVNGMFTNCIIKNIPLFLEQKFFYDPSHYIRIMGYDKPIDFKLHNDFNRTVTIHCKEDKNKK